ncbi:MAG TPA: hypothetical protein VFD67_16400, partial [Gemmatimonadaceae bacterium]|nr:hypothetical protein [Gemmatimonadaceae bacterium]
MSNSRTELRHGGGEPSRIAEAKHVLIRWRKFWRVVHLSIVHDSEAREGVRGRAGIENVLNVTAARCERIADERTVTA